MIGFRQSLGLLLALLLGARLSSAETGEATAGPLAAVQRRIGKVPKYEAKPKYAILVLGPKAEAKVSLVEDGKRLYVDRNGNGDLTDDGLPIEPANVRNLGANEWDFDYVLDELKPGDGSRHTDLKLVRWNYGQKEDGYGMSLKLDGQTPMNAGWNA